MIVKIINIIFTVDWRSNREDYRVKHKVYQQQGIENKNIFDILGKLSSHKQKAAQEWSPAADNGVVEHPWLVVKMAMAINRKEDKTFMKMLIVDGQGEVHVIMFMDREDKSFMKLLINSKPMFKNYVVNFV